MHLLSAEAGPFGWNSIQNSVILLVALRSKRVHGGLDMLPCFTARIKSSIEESIAGATGDIPSASTGTGIAYPRLARKEASKSLSLEDWAIHDNIGLEAQMQRRDLKKSMMELC